MARGKSSAKKIAALQQAEDAVSLRKRGLSFSDIGKALGISKQRAHQIVDAAFAEMRAECTEQVEQLRQIELARLEEIHLKFMPLADPIMLREDPQAIDIAKKAADVVLKTSERRSKLLGLDAPTKSEIAGKDGQPILAGVFAIPTPAQSVDSWAQSAQQSVQPSPAPALPKPTE